MTIGSWIIIALISAALIAAFRPVGPAARTAVPADEPGGAHDAALRHSLGFHE